jgi:hypothetical protein
MPLVKGAVPATMRLLPVRKIGWKALGFPGIRHLNLTRAMPTLLYRRFEAASVCPTSAEVDHPLGQQKSRVDVIKAARLGRSRIDGVGTISKF